MSGRWRCFGIGVLLGALVAAGQAPLGWVWPAMAALVAAIAFIQMGGTARHGAWRGWAVGFGYFAGTLFWIVEPFMVDIARHGWMAPFALAFLAGGLALFWAAAGAMTRWGTLALVASLALAELARGYIFTGFPWALVGYIWAGEPQAQIVAISGPYSLTLLTFLAAGFPTMFGARRAVFGVIAGIAMLATAGIWGQLRLAETAPPRDTEINVRLLQPNAPQHQKWDPDHIGTFLSRQMEMTRDAPASTDLIVWPETAVPYLLDWADDLLRAIAVQSKGRPVIAGITRRATDQSARNAAIVIGPDGRVTATYDKHHLVPFGEYLPFSNALRGIGLTALAEAAGGYSAGPGAQLLDLGPLGKVLPLICYEAIFPQDLRAAPDRADWILQITNDAWFGNLSGPQQHLAQAQFRAIEQGLPVLRSANTGVSAGIDAFGRIIAQLPLNTAGALDVSVPAGLPATVYARIGDAPILFIILMLLGAAVARTERFGVDQKPPQP